MAHLLSIPWGSPRQAVISPRARAALHTADLRETASDRLGDEQYRRSSIHYASEKQVRWPRRVWGLMLCHSADAGAVVSLRGHHTLSPDFHPLLPRQLLRAVDAFGRPKDRSADASVAARPPQHQQRNTEMTSECGISTRPLARHASLLQCGHSVPRRDAAIAPRAGPRATGGFWVAAEA